MGSLYASRIIKSWSRIASIIRGMHKKFDYIDSDEQLIAFSREIASSQWLAVDTEFMRERTYYAQLALVQIASEQACALIDVPALTSLEPLLDAFTRDNCVKIMHSASQDLEVLEQILGAMPQPLFDTQIAAGFLGEAEQIAYASLVRQRLGIELEKDQTRTNWLQRPLSEAQLGYAEADVLYLHELYQQLLSDLGEIERADWVFEESRALAEKTQLAGDPELAWKRLQSLARLKPGQQHIARDLAVWRERRAQQRDLPREWVLKKQALIGIAQRQPQSMQQLRDIEGLGERSIQGIGRLLLKVVDHARQPVSPSVLQCELSAGQRGQVKTLMGRMREIADAESIAPALIANRSTIESLVVGERDLSLLRGWREQVAGRELLEMLENAVTDSG